MGCVSFWLAQQDQAGPVTKRQIVGPTCRLQLTPSRVQWSSAMAAAWM